MLLWSTAYIAMKIAITAYDPIVMIFGRMAIASIIFCSVWKKLFSRIHYKKGDWKLLLLMTLCEPCLYFVFEAYSVKYTTASQAGMIVSLMPLTVAVAARIILKEHLGMRSWIGFFIAISGVCILSLYGSASASAPNPMLGNFFEFCAILAATGYVITTKKLTSSYPPVFLTGLQSTVGFLFFLPAIAMPGVTIPNTFPLLPTLAVIYLGVCIAIFSNALYNYGVSRLPAGQASSFINLVPVMTLVLGVTVLDERLSFVQLLASGLVLAGIILSQTRSRRQPEHVPSQA